jgi:predicted nucleotidyltransferase
MPKTTKQTIISILAAVSEVDQIVLFGSRARGTHNARSDFDLGVAGPKLTRGAVARAQLALEETTIPQQVNLLHISDVLQVRILREIERDGVVWFHR